MYTNLKKVMAQKDVSIEMIARVLGVHRNTIQNKLSGESEFTYDQANIIAATFFSEYRPSWLFKREAEDIA